MSDDLKQALLTLRQGGVILYPTDTVWGIGCDATDQAAVERIYKLKKRTDSKAMLVMVDSSARLDYCVSEIPDMAYDLIDVADRPLTIIYPKARNIAPNLVADDGSIGLRVTAEMFSKSLCEQLRKPIVSTSANISGQPSPASFSEIVEEIRNGVDYIVRYRQNDTTPASPSSIIRLNANNTFIILRK